MRSYLQQLEQKGEMVRVAKEIDPAANMSAVGWKTYNDFSKATLFTNIKGHPDWEACTQILTDRPKWAMALNLAEDGFLPALRLTR